MNGFLCGIKNVPGHGLQGWVVGDGQAHFYGDRAVGKKNAFTEWNEGVPERNVEKEQAETGFNVIIFK